MNPNVYIAGERESGGTCPHCSKLIAIDTPVAVCRECGELHHETCWQLKLQCGSYECSAPKLNNTGDKQVVIKITKDVLDDVVPMPTRESTVPGKDSKNHIERKWNRASIAAFVTAIIGIPLFGIITGLLAIVIACVALVSHTRSHRGFGMAILAMAIGIFDVVGWTVGLSYYYGGTYKSVAFDDFSIDENSLKELPKYLERTLRSNVVITVNSGLGRGGMGSGVVMSIKDNTAYIATNRHVLDSSYNDSTKSIPGDFSDLGKITVSTLSENMLLANVEWFAPGGVDLAIISVPVLSDGVLPAVWDTDLSPKVGQKVFAIGNPHGLGWTHSSGDVSSIRERKRGNYRLQLIQTTAAINSGNSGGGLYSQDGILIGINTLTGDKRMAEGLGFSISLKSLLDLEPPLEMIGGHDKKEE